MIHHTTCTGVNLRAHNRHTLTHKFRIKKTFFSESKDQAAYKDEKK